MCSWKYGNGEEQNIGVLALPIVGVTLDVSILEVFRKKLKLKKGEFRIQVDVYLRFVCGRSNSAFV